MYAVFERKWLYGGPWDLWIRRVDTISAYIKKQKLTPTPQEDLPAHPMMLQNLDLKVARALRPRPFPGGIRGPHLHFKGDVFLLNPEQWRGFSRDVMAQYKERLEKAGDVSFDQLLDIAGGMETL